MQQFKQNVHDLLGLSMNPAQMEAFETYARELAAWNQRISLTAISEPSEVRSKHFLDSLSCWLALRGTPIERVIDLGTGAGFPGLPLKILHPEIQLTLVESVGKKAAFLEHMVQVLGLTDVEVLNQRIETLGQDEAHRESYNWALARALAPMPTLAEYLLPFVKVGGYALAQKGRAAPQEVEEALGAIGKLGGGETELRSADLPEIDRVRYLAIMQKISSTPEKYPRRVGIPTKRPLS